MRCNPLAPGLLALGLFLPAALAQQPLDSSWVYQGNLSSAGENITGSADIEFTIWDAQVGGNQFSTVNLHENVLVTNGLFSLTLDFGLGLLNGDKRWLEISVRSPHDPRGTTSEAAPYITLAPRQQIGATPYAVQTRGLFVDGLSNVGIGTTTPGSPLHVQKGSSGAVTPHFQSLATFEGSGDSFLNLLTPSGSERGILFGDELSVVDGGIIFNNFENLSGLQFRTGNNQTRMTIDASGNVGIGATAPAYPLEVHTNSGLRTISATNYSFGGIAINGYANMEGESIGVRGESHSTTGIGVDGVALATSGNTSGVRGFNQSPFGRGVYGVATSPTGNTIGVLGQSLSTTGKGVYGGAMANAGINYGGWFESNSTTGYGLYGVAWSGSGITYGVYGRTHSLTGRGTYGHASHTSGTNYGAVGRSDSPNGFDFYASGAGTNYGSASSRRWKSNVANIADPLDKLAALRGVYFDWDDEHGGHHDVGMIAEEVGKVLPEIVNYEDNGYDAIGMDYSKLTPLLVEAVNALRAENDALRERLEKLESSTQNHATQDGSQ